MQGELEQHYYFLIKGKTSENPCSNLHLMSYLTTRFCNDKCLCADHRPGITTLDPYHKLRSQERCEVNYLGRLEIIHFENIVGTRSSLMRISGVDSSGTTPGGGLGDTPYFNSLRIVVGTQSVLANPLHILQPCAVD